MHGLKGRLVACFLLVVMPHFSLHAEEDAPWLKYDVAENPIIRLQKQVGTRARHALCRGRVVETRSPLDKAVLPAQSVAELTPALAQVVGFVSMIAEDQRESVQMLSIKELKAKGAWTQAAEHGYFKYLLIHAEEERNKADAAMSVAGAVAGGLTGALSSGILNDLGAYTLAGQTLVQGKETGSEYAKTFRPTAFNIIQDESSVAAVLDAVIDEPCRFSATDAIIVLRVGSPPGR